MSANSVEVTADGLKIVKGCIMVKHKSIFLASVLCLCGFAWLSPNASAAAIKSRRVVGTGTTRSRAIAEALMEAIRQVDGVRLKGSKDFSEKAVTRRLRVVLDDKDGQTRRQASYSDKDTARFKQRIGMVTYGLVHSYRVVDVRQANGTYRATLMVDVLVFNDETRARLHRKAIAVLPFGASHQQFSIGDAAVSSANLCDRLNENIVRHLVQSRRFTVLDRQYLKEVVGEQKFIASRSMPLQEKVKLGQMIGADYLIVGALQNARVSAHHKSVKLTGYHYTNYTGGMSIAYRVVDVATAQDHWAGQVEVDLLANKTFERWKKGRSNPDIAAFLVNHASDQLVTRLISAIHPIKVIKATKGGAVILNRGGASIKVGDEFGVFSWGEALIDPDTGENLGPDERRLGTIRVTRVLSKVSYAKLIEGDASAIKPRSICRRQ